MLVTPLVRRIFDGDKFTNVLAAWSERMRQVAAELDVPLVDLNRESAEMVANLGPERARYLAQLLPGQKDGGAVRANA